MNVIKFSFPKILSASVRNKFFIANISVKFVTKIIRALEDMLIQQGRRTQ